TPGRRRGRCAIGWSTRAGVVHDRGERGVGDAGETDVVDAPADATHGLVARDAESNADALAGERSPEIDGDDVGVGPRRVGTDISLAARQRVPGEVSDDA